MRIRPFVFAATAIAIAAPVFAQPKQAAQQQGSQTQLRPKSPKEQAALQKVQAAAQQNNPDAEVQAINDVLENFQDTAYKNMLLTMAMDAEARKGDYDQTIVWGERAVQADPTNIQAYDTLAQEIAQHTRENDLDKAKSVQKVNIYADKALDLLKTTSTPPAGVPPEQWPDLKKDLTAQAYEAKGMISAVDKKYPQAIDQYKTAISGASKPNAVTMARLAQAYNGAKQYDDAISTADKVLAMSTVQPAVKQFAQQQKEMATKLKAGAGSIPAPGPAK